ncbi:MAG: hypothetical protein ACI9ON_002730 [Limisphaerales bacterium]
MNLERTNHWLALAANVGVLAGIIFLAYELQQNTVATQLEATSNFQESFTEIEMLIAGNPEFAELLLKGVAGENISAVEEFRLAAFYTNVLRQWQFIHFQFLTDAIDEEIWHGERSYLASVIAQDIGLFKHWRSSKGNYSRQFNEMIESISDEQ